MYLIYFINLYLVYVAKYYKIDKFYKCQIPVNRRIVSNFDWSLQFLLLKFHTEYHKNECWLQNFLLKSSQDQWWLMIVIFQTVFVKNVTAQWKF